MKLAGRGVISCLLTIAYTCLSPIQAAEPADELETLRNDVESLKAGQRAIRKDVESIKNLLQSQQRRRSPVRDVNTTLQVGADPYKGLADAKLTLIEFSDYQCPFCARHTRSVLPQLEKNYVDSGKLRYVLRDFPLDFHKQAAKAHEAAHCAGEQGKYWQMHAQLFANQKALHLERLPGHAKTAGLQDLAAFEDCLSSGKYAERIDASKAEGGKLGIRGTPSFAIGLTATDGSVKAKKIVRGAQPYAIFQKILDELLATDAGEQAPPSKEEKG